MPTQTLSARPDTMTPETYDRLVGAAAHFQAGVDAVNKTPDASPLSRADYEMLRRRGKFSDFAPADRYLLIPALHTLLPEETRGDVSVSHFTMGDEESALTALRAAMRHEPNLFCPPGRYTRLQMPASEKHDCVMMSDTPMERRTNADVLANARGHVLIGGLGLGMLLTVLPYLHEVKTITVIENDARVLDIIKPRFRHAKTQVTLGDVFTWTPAPGKGFDCIYLDVWPTIGPENIPDYDALRARYAPMLAPGGWYGAWMETYVRERLAASE